MIKTFRGVLADGGQDRIRLSTIKGKVGYKIVKFEVISPTPVNSSSEHVCKLFKTEQSSIDATIDFTDSNLLGVAVWTTNGTAQNYPEDMTVIFDREIFNQDIYITQSEQSGSQPLNYYLELEVIPLDDAGAEYTTLKDMRSA